MYLSDLFDAGRKSVPCPMPRFRNKHESFGNFARLRVVTGACCTWSATINQQSLTLLLLRSVACRERFEHPRQWLCLAFVGMTLQATSLLRR